MAQCNEKYQKLNPFVQNAVGENVIWDSEEKDFCDVESINMPAFQAIFSDIKLVNDDSRTRARFLVGAAGSGKSHLFARLRRRLAEGQFTFVSNPPSAGIHIKRFILRKIVSGMRRPVMGPDGPLPFSQLQRVVYFLLQKILKPKGLKPKQIHGWWRKEVKRADYAKILGIWEKALSNFPPLEIPLHWRRVFFRVLDDERRDLAAAWLSGNQSLREPDYQSLGVSGPLGDDEISGLIKQLGHLSIGAGPIVLILDQLDGLTKPDQIHEIESLMIDLNDGSRNWYVIVSLVQEKFDLWYSVLSTPFKERFGTATGDSVSLATAELLSLSKEQRRELILARLGAPQLRLQRQTDGIENACYPLAPAEVERLTRSDIRTPRLLIQRAQQAYNGTVTGHTDLAATLLSDFVDQIFADLRAELRADDLAVDTPAIADRVGELFRLIWDVRTNSDLQISDGPLHVEAPNFEGVDRIYACKHTNLRVVHYDVQQGNKFPGILKKIVNSHPTTLLIRDGRVSVSGKVTRERLDLFMKDKEFLHLSLDQIKDLHALGMLLAKMREGEFENENTDPEPTERNINECLARYGALDQTDLCRTFLVMVGLEKRTPKPSTPDHAGSRPDGQGAFLEGDPIAAGVADIMAAERWMSFERLCARVSSRGVSADPEQIYARLTARPISDSVITYPRDANLLESIGIVIWALEE
jgi:hypothetical protein